MNSHSVSFIINLNWVLTTIVVKCWSEASSSVDYEGLKLIMTTPLQVSAIAWNREYREMISAHGNPKHQMTVWKFPSMLRIGELVGHQGRVLHMCLSPKKTTVASASADETLRIWKCFAHSKKLDQSQSQTEDSITALLHSVR